MKKILLILILALIFLAGCSKIYVCYDGTEQKTANKCPTVPVANVAEKDASAAVEKFGQAYALARNDRFTKVNIYRQDGHWWSDGLFTNIKTQEVHPVKLKIDGKTASITCIEGCDYLGLNTSPE